MHRKSLLTARQQLSVSQRLSAAQHVYKIIKAQSFFRRAKKIAFYHAIRGELDPQLLLTKAIKLHKKCYLPILHPLKHNRLWFGNYSSAQDCQINRFKIPEPNKNNLIAPWALDLIFVPLVGFDDQCHRLGMGKGYYDRTFAFKKNTCNKRPLLVGIAYEVQKVPHLIPKPWDVSLDYVVTEKTIYRKPFSNTSL